MCRHQSACRNRLPWRRVRRQRRLRLLSGFDCLRFCDLRSHQRHLFDQFRNSRQHLPRRPVRRFRQLQRVSCCYCLHVIDLQFEQRHVSDN